MKAQQPEISAAGPFRFKKFEVRHDRCAMKVGTDAVLLGAYIFPGSYHSILDAGTGTGLLSLMMAQRFPEALITAIEIDEDACRQAEENFSSSPWANRLSLHHVPFQEFSASTREKYDLLISNPPYFEGINTTKGNNTQRPGHQRSQARFTGHLGYGELLEGAGIILNEEGDLWLIIPFLNFNEFNELAAAKGFFLNHRLLIRGKEGKDFNRCILCYSLKKKEKSEAELSIYFAAGNYSDEYRRLTKDFYLNF
jgi:tRNA1Val (adenine37-N6)-methyltransferase